MARASPASCGVSGTVSFPLAYGTTVLYAALVSTAWAAKRTPPLRAVQHPPRPAQTPRGHAPCVAGAAVYAQRPGNTPGPSTDTAPRGVVYGLCDEPVLCRYTPRHQPCTASQWL